MSESPRFGNISMYQAAAQYLGVDEAEVIDNNDGESITVFDMIYLIFPLELGLSEYKYAIIPYN
ncbi:hypothetical protein [Peribacillus frigoritolerans]|uniref:Uncharacterized protein n=1 Tax=Peribacillus castrilensis TaxID=2897690 RepID=A0AAW9NL15_9BACI|nr:hypothetical protein [Peribacillus castrilensis]